MESIITKRGQVVVPVALRRKYGITTGAKVAWIDTGSVIKLIPLPKDPVGSLRGCSDGEKLTKSLLKDRKEDKRLEE